METEREQRFIHNEEAFRRANERLHEDWGRLGIGPAAEALFLCECGDAACLEAIRIQLSEYEALRADPEAFMLIPGHEDAAVETVDDGGVDPDGRYIVVHKSRGVG
jgi:hypothetical protein